MIPSILHPKRSSSNYKDTSSSLFISNYVVPPALPEVRQPMTERYLEQLKYYATYPAHLHISNYHHLEPPSEQMSYKMHIECSLIYVNKVIIRVFRCVYPTILGIALFWKWVPELRVKKFEDLSCVIQRLEEHIDHEEGVEGHGSGEDSPEDGVGALY